MRLSWSVFLYLDITGVVFLIALHDSTGWVKRQNWPSWAWSTWDGSASYPSLIPNNSQLVLMNRTESFRIKSGRDILYVICSYNQLTINSIPYSRAVTARHARQVFTFLVWTSRLAWESRTSYRTGGARLLPGTGRGGGGAKEQPQLQSDNSGSADETRGRSGLEI